MRIKLANLEDEEDIHEIIHELSPEFGIDYKSMATLQQLEQFIQGPENVDVLFVDDWIQGREAFGYIEKIKQNKKAKFVFAISGHLPEESRCRAFQAGADYFIEKPYDIYKVLEQVQQLFVQSAAKQSLPKKQQALLLSRDPAQCESLAKLLLQKNYLVTSFQSLSSLEGAVKKLKPQMIFVSKHVSTLLKDRLADYLRAKYNLPVLVFSEDNQDVEYELIRYQVMQADVEQSRVELDKLDKKIWRKIESLFSKTVDLQDVMDEEKCLSSYCFMLQAESGSLVYKFCTDEGMESRRGDILGRVREMIYSELDKSLRFSETEVKVLSSYYNKNLQPNLRLFCGEHQGSRILASSIVRHNNPWSCGWIESLGVFQVPVEAWLPEVRLNFPLYISKDKNNGKSLCVKSGETLSQDEFSRLQGAGAYLLVDAEHFESYSLARRILAG